MNTGRLRHRITIQEFEQTLNDYGENIKTWETFHECWADVRFKSGKEEEKGEKLNSIYKYSVKIRFKSNITTDMRISWNNQILQIAAVLPDRTNKKYQIIECFENADN